MLYKIVITFPGRLNNKPNFPRHLNVQSLKMNVLWNIHYADNTENWTKPLQSFLFTKTRLIALHREKKKL